MLYTPPAFKESEALARELLRTYDFGLLITATGFSHLPMVLDGDRLIGHLARANPQRLELATGAPVRAVFQGPHAYVSPRWYAEDPTNVPTWNYAVVHAQGTPRVLEDEQETFAALRALIERHDPAWQLNESAEVRAMAKAGIVAFEIQLSSVEIKAKLSQNRTPEDRLSVATQLLRSPIEEERRTGALMLRINPP